MVDQYVVGIDPSLSGTAVCVMHTTTHMRNVCRFTSKPASGVHGRMQRYARLARDIVYEIGQRTAGGVIRVVVIEGYAFASANQAHYLGEFGGILRHHLWEFLDCKDDLIRECPPSTLCSFVMGRGGGGKNQMGANVAHRWGQVFTSDDEVDSYALARLALCVGGHVEPENQFQRAAVDIVLHGKPKKPRKKKVVDDDNF